MSHTTASENSDSSVLYHYAPSLGLAAAFCAAFGLSTVLHTYQAIRVRSWYMIPILIGGACETIGYLGRILGANEGPDYTLAPYIIQAILLLIPPSLIAASIYMVMGHIIRATNGDRYSIIREQVLTKVFVIGDVMSFLIQSTGAGMLTKKEQDKKDAGKYIVIGGLFVQLLSFGFFMVVTVIFWGRLTSDKPQSSQLKHEGVRWRLHLITLFITSILIMTRSVFRIIEYAQGPEGYLLSHEIYLYMFDGVLMFLSMVILNLIHPSGISALNNGGKAIRKVFATKSVEICHLTEKTEQGADEETAYIPIMPEVQNDR